MLGIAPVNLAMDMDPEQTGRTLAHLHEQCQDEMLQHYIMIVLDHYFVMSPEKRAENEKAMAEGTILDAVPTHMMIVHHCKDATPTTSFTFESITGVVFYRYMVREATIKIDAMWLEEAHKPIVMGRFLAMPDYRPCLFILAVPEDNKNLQTVCTDLGFQEYGPTERSYGTPEWRYCDSKHCYKCGKIPGKEEPVLNRCMQCRTAFYCSVECQKTDWKRHKLHCRSDRLRIL